MPTVSEESINMVTMLLANFTLIWSKTLNYGKPMAIYWLKQYVPAQKISFCCQVNHLFKELIFALEFN